MKILATVLGCAIFVSLVVVAFIYSGIYDYSTLHASNPIVSWALTEISDRSIAVRIASIVVPSGLDQPEVIQAGGQLFVEEHCWLCHRAPGLLPTAIAQGLDLPPTDLFSASRQPSMQRMFWIIRNGVKMTAMPGFGEIFSDDEIWSIAAFLKSAPGMSAQEFAWRTDRPPYPN
jgi:mono/diheme cytochrome c family protein